MKATITFFLLNILLNYFCYSQSNLVGSYNFNGNANDASGNNYNGTVFGATLTTDRYGVPDRAYSFNGINNYITLPSNTFGLSNFTYSAWVNTSNYLQYAQAIISIGNAGADQVISMVNLSQTAGGQNWQFFSYVVIGQSPAPSIVIPSPNVNDVWHHVVATRSQNDLKLFIDGSFVGVTNVSSPPAYNTPVLASIGARSTNNTQFFSGKIDDVSIYNRVLSAQEVSNLYNYNTLEAPAAAGSASFILQVNDAESDFVFNANGAPTTELARLKGTGKLGLATPDPKSTLDINGTFGTKIKKITVNGTTTLDESATVWYFTNIGSITLPSAASCPNRRYSIVNRRPEARVFTNSYIDLNGGNNTYILANSGIELISDGTNWLQIK